MVRLEKIQKTGSLIQCNIFVEDCAVSVPLSVDVLNPKNVNCTLPSGYEWCTMHIQHAVGYLLDIETDPAFPESKLIMWY